MSFKVDIKRIVSILLVSLFFVSISNVTASAALRDLSDNEEVSIEVLKEGEDSLSAADDCINDIGTIKIEDGKTMLYMTLTDNGSATLKGYLNNVYYYKNVDDYNNDVKSNANIISTNALGYPEEISIELTSDVKTVEDKDTEGDKDGEDSENTGNVLDLKDGTYSVSASFIKTNSDDVSMANNCIEENSKLVVENGVGKIYLTLKGMNFAGIEAWITNLWFYNNNYDYINGTKNEVEVISTNDKNYPEVIAFTLPSKSDVIYLTAETSDSYHSSSDVRLKLDYSSAINEKALINIKDGKAEVYISTKPLTMGTITASLQTLQYEETDGTYTYAKVTTKSADGTPTGFKFTLPSYDEIINVKVNPMVAMMGNKDIQARLNIDYSTMVLAIDAQLPIEDVEDEKEEEKVEGVTDDKIESSTGTTNSNGVNNTITNIPTVDTGDNSNMIAVVTMLMMSLGAVFAAKKRV